MNIFYWQFIGVLYFGQIFGVLGQFDMIKYKGMPPLYSFEDYDKCMDYNNISATHLEYCMVFAEIVPNANSTLWQQIQYFSADERHYRHDHLFFGICLNSCRKLLTSLDVDQDIKNGNIHDTEIADYYVDVHKRSVDERLRYDHIINRCLNYKVQGSYNLSVRSTIEYCEKSNNPLEIDTLDIVVYAIIFCVGLLNLVSSAFDCRLKLQQSSYDKRENFYRTELTTYVGKLLTSFSLCRNYHRITSTLPRKCKIAENLKFLNGMRSMGVFLVIFVHILMLFMAVQIENPEFFEKYFYRLETAIIQNGAPVIQIFFVISGFLLYINFSGRHLVTSTTSKIDCIKIYFKMCVYRYSRIVPSLMALMLFNATILVRLQNGPFWRHFTEAERTFCRELWWKNIFLVNNYMMKKSCAHHTWYLATDMQLFEFFSIVLILIAKYPKTKKFLLTTIGLLGFGIPTVLTYYLKLDVTYQSYPENYRYLFFKNASTFYEAYTPFHTNLSGYLGGILCAHIYVTAIKRNTFAQLRGIWKFEISWWLIFPAGIGLLLLCGVLLKSKSENPLIWTALFAGIYKSLWVVIFCCMLLGLCYKLGWIFYEFACNSFTHVLANISFQIYLWHVVILRLIGGIYSQPININHFFLICNVIVTLLITSVVAFFMALLVEYPIAEVIKCLIAKSNGQPAVKDGNVDVVLNEVNVFKL